jgi:hypothetical protein
MSGICGDNRFEIIDKVKKRLLEATNIEQSPKELEVLDNLLFRLWQCGYFDYIEIFEKNEMTFEEWYKKSDCELTGVTIGVARCIFQAGAKEVQKENKQLQKHNKYVLDLIKAERRRQEECDDVHLRNIAILDKENQQLKQQLENEKQLNAEIKKRLVEVEYDCEEFNHEYCDINCKGKRKELVDLYQLISDGLNETLLKQKEDEIKELKEVIKNLRCCENCIDYTKLYETEGCDCENLCNWRMNNEKKN